MIYKDQNFSFGDILGHNFKNGDEFHRCNFVQSQQGFLFPSLSGLKFKECNLYNCLLPNDSIVIDCAGYQINGENKRGKIEFCANNHPELIAKGLLQPEPQDCKHSTLIEGYQIGTEIIVPDHYEYEDIVSIETF